VAPPFHEHAAHVGAQARRDGLEAPHARAHLRRGSERRGATRDFCCPWQIGNIVGLCTETLEKKNTVTWAPVAARVRRRWRTARVRPDRPSVMKVRHTAGPATAAAAPAPAADTNASEAPGQPSSGAASSRPHARTASTPSAVMVSPSGSSSTYTRVDTHTNTRCVVGLRNI
jgi:hypothetical protein